MINLTATTESNAQVITYFTTTDPSNSSWYAQVRCVAWISQQKYDSNSNYSPKTTIKYKWQVYQYNYYPYWNDSHTYTLSLGGTSNSVSFNLPQSTSNGTRNMCSARTLGTFSHNTSTGAYSGTFRFQGAKWWTTFDYSESMTLPTITPPAPEPEPTPTPEPEPEPDPPTPLEFDNDPKYYIYADGDLVYAAGIEGYEIINPKLTLEVNKAGSLTFDIPIGSAMYNELNLLKTTIECRQGNEVLFRGRVLNTKRSFYNTLTYYCEGFMAWMNDISTVPYTKTGIVARDLLKQYIRWYNDRASTNRQISYKYSDITAVVSFEETNYSNLWEQTKKNLVDGIGGYIVPYLTSSETGIQWLSTYGASTSQVIRFGENLLDFSEYIDASSLYTVVRPYGKMVSGSRVRLTEEFLANTEAVAEFGRIERVAIFDEITTESALRTAATSYLRLGTTMDMSLSISAIDLHLLNQNIERIRIGDSVRVVSVPHEIDAYFLCTKVVIDLQDASHTVFTLGSTQRTISELTNASPSQYVITEGV